MLRHLLNYIGKKGFLTRDILHKLTRVVSNNIIALYQYKKSETRYVDTKHISQGGAGAN